MNPAEFIKLGDVIEVKGFPGQFKCISTEQTEDTFGTFIPYTPDPLIKLINVRMKRMWDRGWLRKGK